MGNLINNLSAIVGIAICAAVIYMVFSILDNERIMRRHPYFRNPVLRGLLGAMMLAQLAEILFPEYSALCALLFDLSLLLGLIVFGWLYSRHVVKVGVGYSAQDNPPILTEVVYVNVPTDHYVGVAPGVFYRVLTSANDLQHDVERYYADAIQLQDFGRSVIIFMQFSASASFQPHYQLGEKQFTVLSGAFRLQPGQAPAQEGDTVVIPPRTVHSIEGVEAGSALLAMPRK
jgi:mannose-6-phosphate isomerase-like protein (cupin superfamily)